MFGDIASGIGAFGHGVIGYLVPFLFVLTIVVFFHELGHFLVARLCGVKVLTFSIGFGPELFGFNDRHGTRWKISAIPLGGYVKFFGDDNAASVPDADGGREMSAAERASASSISRSRSRAAIVAAGPIANFILAIVIFAGVFTIYGKPIDASARVDTVQENSAAAAAGFAARRCRSVDRRQQHRQFQRHAAHRFDQRRQAAEIVVERGGAQVTLTATPELREVKDSFGNVHRIGVLGISRADGAGRAARSQPVNPFKAVWLGAQETWFVVDRTMSYLGGMVAGRESADQLGGPIRIAQVSGQVATAGIAALHSSRGGAFGLDRPAESVSGAAARWRASSVLRHRGGRGRPLSERAQEFGFRVGLALVAMLMIFATYNDIRNLAPS